MMKCVFCGKEVEKGSEICPHCGMILSLGDDNGEVTIPEYTPNVFSSERRKEKKVEQAMELEISDVEETVPVVESIPEFAPAEYDFTPVSGEIKMAEAEPETASQAAEKTALQEEAAEEADEALAEEAVNAAEACEDNEADDTAESIEEAQEQMQEADGADSADEAEENQADEEQSAETDEAAAAAAILAASAEDNVQAAEDVYKAPSYEDFNATETISTEPSEDDVAYPEYADFAETEGEYENVEDIICVNEEESEDNEAVAVPVPDSDEPDSDDDDDSDDIYVKPSKGKSGIITIVALCIVLVGLVVAGGYVVKNVLPEKKPTEPTVSVGASATEEATTEDEADTHEETTADDVTEETTEDDVTAESEETTEEVTTAPSTTVSSTTKPNTTRPNTTKPNTTRPNTTRPNTTKPTTTKPTTTDPYGYNDVEIKAPKKYLAESYKGYITADSVTVRASAAATAPRYFYLVKGSEVIVKAKENGFCYVYSTRFATHGWVNASYISTSRPVEETTKVNTGTVRPDVDGSGETKYATNMLNMRKGPSTDYGIVNVIPVGHPVKIIGYKSGVSGWAYVTDLTTGVNGWVSTAYLKS